MYKLKIDMPNLAPGATVELDGLGIFQNAGTYEITEAEADVFQSRATVYNSTFDSSGRIIIEKIIGPDLVEAFSEVEGIEVTLLGKDPDNA